MDWLARIEACASEFEPEAIERAKAHLAAGNVLLAALALGSDVWQPKTPGEQLRHDIRTALDQAAGVVYEAPRKRRRRNV